MSAGFKLSFSAKNKDALKPISKAKSAANGAPLAKRPRLALDDDEPEEKQKTVEISGWDTATGGAIDLNAKKEEGPRVIPALPNQWHAIAKAKVAKQAQSSGKGQGREGGYVEELKDTEIAYGLTVTKKVVKDGEEEVEVEEMVDEMEKGDGLTEEQRLEKRALDALINGKATDTQAVIQQSEQEAFEHDYANAPDAPTLDAYEATPIEGFGAALLRGMGWKDGEEIGRSKNSTTTKAKEVKRRPALLGIGAKEEAAVGVEFGEYGGKGKGSKRKIDQAYNPIVMRNKKTGELISEEELKTKIEGQDLVQEDEGKDAKGEKSRRSKYDDYSEDEDHGRDRKRTERKERDQRDRREEQDERRRDKYRDRDRRREDYYDSDRRKDKRREDDRYDSDRRKEKRRDEDYYDRDRRKDKRREDDRYDSDRRKDKRRDEDYYDSDRKKDKYREREQRDTDKSGSPDSEDRRKRRRDYDDERNDRKRRHRDDKYYRC